MNLKNRLHFKCTAIFKMCVNVSQLPEGGDYEAIICQPSTNFDRCTKFDFTMSAPIAANGCYGHFLLPLVVK